MGHGTPTNDQSAISLPLENVQNKDIDVSLLSFQSNEFLFRKI